MSYFLWHVIADMSGNWFSILDEQKSDLTKPEYSFDNQLRFVSYAVRQSLSDGWPASDFSNVNTGFLGGDNSTESLFEQPSASVGGMSRQSFVIGSVLSPTGLPIGSCVVMLYLASTGQLVFSGVTDPNGNYMLPTPYAGQNHFIYANYNSGQYIGSSVSTLTPNF
jgi:hypothetical protein